MAGMAALMEGVDDAMEGQRERLLGGVEEMWDEVEETAEGTLILHDSFLRKRNEAKRQAAMEVMQGVKRGMIRDLVLIIDNSAPMESDDLRPTRWDCVLDVTEQFIHSFFDQNPISHLALAVMRDGRTDALSSLSGNKSKHLAQISKLRDRTKSDGPKGDASIQNALIYATKILTAMPSHSTREVVIIFGGLASCDPGDVFKTIKAAAAKRIRVSVIGLSAAVKLCQTVTKETNGIYSVILDEAHLSQLLMHHTVPPVADVDNRSALVHMGFPTYSLHPQLEQREKHGAEGQVARQQASQTAAASVGAPIYSMGKRKMYRCPRCGSLEAELPAECRTCGLFLVLSPHLARTFHHLFPLPSFAEVRDVVGTCAGCNRDVRQLAFECPRCASFYCADCDLFLHETLHNCPSCSVRQTKAD